MAPWILFLMMGVFDFGFYAYAAIATANAARVAALYTSSSPGAAAHTQGACDLVKQEMSSMLNFNQISADCSALPLRVTAIALDATTTPASADGQPSSRVSVTYQTIPLFPIPGLMGQWTLTRAVEMRVME